MENNQVSEGHKIIYFIVYTIGVYACFICSSVFQQKIYKVPYTANGSISDGTTGDIFTDRITPFGFTSGIACLFGYLMIKDQFISFDIPLKQLMKVSACDILIHACLITALLRTTYTTMIIVNTCSLLSVVLVASFCSGVREVNRENEGDVVAEGVVVNSTVRKAESEKIGPQKLWICSVVCFGIIIFSYFAPPKQENDKSQQSGGLLLTIIVFAVAIVLQGFRPDFVAQIKQTYRPDSLFLLFGINGVTFCLVFILSIISWQISYFVSFVIHHDGFLFDLTCMGVLSSVGSMFSYKLINMFRQHIYPLVANTRKCATVCVNIIWFGHHLAWLQWVGVALVFGAIMVQIINNYNLARKILPNENVRNREGQNYNKIIAKEDYLCRNEGNMYIEDVEGI